MKLADMLSSGLVCVAGGLPIEAPMECSLPEERHHACTLPPNNHH
jgi:hypothetical protein